MYIYPWYVVIAQDATWAEHITQNRRNSKHITQNTKTSNQNNMVEIIKW